MHFMEKFPRKIEKSVVLTPIEKKKYLMVNEKDYEILSKIRQLEKLKLSKEDKYLVGLVRTRLENDWRTPLARALDNLLRKY